MTSSTGKRTRVAVRLRIALLLLVSFTTLLIVRTTYAAAAPREGHAVRPLHGPGYEHLDCSACLAVSRSLFVRLNNTLRDNPSTYLASHRLNQKNKLKRVPYRNSELLVAEVMENFCARYENDERALRLHPKSKVRLYHQQVWKDITLGVRPTLLEGDVYPEGAHEPEWDTYVEGRRYPIAKAYSPKDQEALHGMEMLAATPTMCAALVEDYEEEIEELVKLAHNLSDIEYGLCGLPLPEVQGDQTAQAEVEEVRATIQPITNICARTELIRAAAQRDQLRWSQFMRREERRLQKVAEKQKASRKPSAEDAEDAEEDAAGEKEEEEREARESGAEEGAAAEAARAEEVQVPETVGDDAATATPDTTAQVTEPADESAAAEEPPAAQDEEEAKTAAVADEEDDVDL